MEGLRASMKPSAALALIGCSVSRMLSLGLVGCASVFYNEIRAEFQSSHFATSLLFAIGLGIMQGSGLIMTFLLKRFTERQVVVAGGVISGFGVITAYFATSLSQLMVSLGVIHSFGQGLGFVASTVAASFVLEEKYHHVAISIQNVGNALGVLLFPVLFEKLIGCYGWRGSLLTITGISLNQCVCGLLMDNADIRRYKEMAQMNENQLPPPPSPIPEEEDEVFECVENGVQKRISVRRPLRRRLSSRFRQSLRAFGHFEIWKDARFLLLLTNAFVHCFSYSIYFTFAYTHMLSQGVLASSAALVFSSYAIASIVARISTAFLDNKCMVCSLSLSGNVCSDGYYRTLQVLRRWLVFGYGHCLAGAAVLVFGLLPSSNALHYAIPMVFIGLANGLIDPLICCVALDVLGPMKLSDSFSFLMTFWGIGGFSGATVGGMVRDQLSSFTVPLVIAAGGEMFAGLVLSPLKCYPKYYEETLACRKKEMLAVKEGEDPVRTSLMHLHLEE